MTTKNNIWLPKMYDWVFLCLSLSHRNYSLYPPTLTFVLSLPLCQYLSTFLEWNSLMSLLWREIKEVWSQEQVLHAREETPVATLKSEDLFSPSALVLLERSGSHDQRWGKNAGGVKQHLFSSHRLCQVVSFGKILLGEFPYTASSNEDTRILFKFWTFGWIKKGAKILKQIKKGTEQDES